MKKLNIFKSKMYRKSIVFTLATAAIATSLLLPPKADASTFKDVKDNHWAYSAVEQAAQKKYIAGYTDGTFKPNGKVTRAEFAAFLARLFDEDKRVTEPFTDVSNTHWAKPAIEEGIALGFINPADYKNNKFEPSKVMTRAEIAKWLTNALIASNSEYKEIEQTLKNSSLTLLPVAEFTKGTMAKNDVGTVGVMIGTNLLVGYTDGTFKVNGNTTRAEVASIIMRYLKVADKNPSDIKELQELIEVAETGTNLHTMGGEFKYEEKGRNFEALRQEQHKMANGNGTIRINRMIVIDTSDANNFKGVFKEVFRRDGQNIIKGYVNSKALTVAVEHAYKPIKSTSNAKWYPTVQPTHNLLGSAGPYRDMKYDLPSVPMYHDGWKFDKNGEQLMWFTTGISGIPTRYSMQHVVNGKDYYFAVLHD